MKYCKNCGMLLEDSQETCMGCGMDVSAPGSTSLYPPDVQKKIENRDREDKQKTGMVGLILLVLVLLIAMIGVFVYLMIQKNGGKLLQKQTAAPTAVEQTASAPVDKVEEEAEEANPSALPEVSAQNETSDLEAANKPADSNRTVSDSNGRYYERKKISDDGGNVIFTTVYPEDFVNTESSTDYTKCSEKFPISFSFIAGNAENTARFFYMSPQQFWYKVSETGKTRTNERDLTNYMSYLEYSDAQTYIELLIREFYGKVKSVKLVESYAVNDGVSGDFSQMANAFSKSLLTGIGDYAHISSDTLYAKMESDCSANIFKYEIVTKEGINMFCDYYVPVMSNVFTYSSEMADDRGNITEWIVPCVMGFEAGNEDFYDEYREDFNLFIKNSQMTPVFYSICSQYGAKIEDSIKKHEEARALDGPQLADFGKKYKEGENISEFYDGINNVFSEAGSEALGYKSEKGDTINVPEDVKVVFINEEDEKVFVSPSEDEYPGDSYEQLNSVEGNSQDGENVNE